MRPVFLLQLFAFGLILLSACCSCHKNEQNKTQKQSPDTFENNKVQIVATTGMIADMVSEIGGKNVQVKGLMGPGVDPHLYKPSASDAASLQQADLIFYNGLLLEGRMAELLDRLKKIKKNSVYALCDALQPKQLLSEKSNTNHPDPHIWGDVLLWSQCVPIIEKALINKNPSQKELYTQQARTLEDKLSKLHHWSINRLSKIPPEKEFSPGLSILA